MSASPSDNHRLIIILPEKCSDPTLVWMEATNMKVAYNSLQPFLSESCPCEGVESSVQDTNGFRRFDLDHDYYLSVRSDFTHDGSLPNTINAWSTYVDHS